MCVAAIALEGGYSKDLLRKFFMANPHGGSFTYVENGKLVIKKHMMIMEEYVEEGERLKDKRNLMTHCRYRTQGHMNMDNAHPFLLNKGKAAMVHNGNFFSSSNEAKSDSAEFAEMADVLGREELITADVVSKVNRIVGTHNKMILLFDSGNFTIFNEKLGSWLLDNKMWVSNTYYDTSFGRTHHYN